MAEPLSPPPPPLNGPAIEKILFFTASLTQDLELQSTDLQQKETKKERLSTRIFLFLTKLNSLLFVKHFFLQNETKIFLVESIILFCKPRKSQEGG